MIELPCVIELCWVGTRSRRGSSICNVLSQILKLYIKYGKCCQKNQVLSA